MSVKIGRNDPCWCGSGKKYKLCCINKMSEEEIQALYLEQAIRHLMSASQ